MTVLSCQMPPSGALVRSSSDADAYRRSVNKLCYACRLSAPYPIGRMPVSRRQRRGASTRRRLFQFRRRLFRVRGMTLIRPPTRRAESTVHQIVKHEGHRFAGLSYNRISSRGYLYWACTEHLLTVAYGVGTLLFEACTVLAKRKLGAVASEGFSF